SGLRPDTRPNHRLGRVNRRGLEGADHQIHHADLARAAEGLRLEVKVAVTAMNRQPAAPYHLQIPPHEKPHIMAGPGETSAIETADRAGTNNRNAHGGSVTRADESCNMRVAAQVWF